MYQLWHAERSVLTVREIVKELTTDSYTTTDWEIWLTKETKSPTRPIILQMNTMTTSGSSATKHLRRCNFSRGKKKKWELAPKRKTINRKISTKRQRFGLILEQSAYDSMTRISLNFTSTIFIGWLTNSPTHGLTQGRAPRCSLRGERNCPNQNFGIALGDLLVHPAWSNVSNNAGRYTPDFPRYHSLFNNITFSNWWIHKY